MKNKTIVGALVAAAVGFAGFASADSITPDTIYGSGNSNGNFTVDRNNGVELGLRAEIPFSGVTNYDGNMTYSYTTVDIMTGVKIVNGVPVVQDAWNFDWSINTDYDGSSGYLLSDLVYKLEFDYDPSLATAYAAFGSDYGITNGDPVAPAGFVTYFDHSIGTNATPNDGGAEAGGVTDPNPPATYADLLANNNVLQNSWRGQWMGAGAPTAAFDPYAPGTYNVRLSAYDVSGNQLASTEIKVNINGGAPVPEPATMTLLGLGLAGLGYRARKRAKA